MADIFDVVADGTRRDILQVLLEQTLAEGDSTGDMSVTQIVASLKLSQPTVSKHLKVLREAGLVSVREDGQRRFYRLNPDPLEQVEDWLIPFLSLGFDEQAEAEGDAARLPESATAAAVRLGEVLADLRHAVLRKPSEAS